MIRARKDEAPAGDLFPLNNKIETYITVTKEGVSVLLVDKQRAMEPQFICDALEQDPRIRVTPVWLRGGQTLDANSGDLFRFDKQQYDVIILGDVTAGQMRDVSPQSLQSIEHLVEQGSGFLMLGGYSPFGNSDWQGTAIEKLLPIDLDNSRGQIEEDRLMVPTQDGLRKLRLPPAPDRREGPEESLADLPPLEGHLPPAPKSNKGIETVLAESNKDEPILIAQNYGDGRVLAFAGDTTHRWVVSPAKTADALRASGDRWSSWLAKQEDAEGTVWVKPDTRRLPARSDLGFSVGVRSKGGIDLKDGAYKVEVAGPDGVKTPVPTARTAADDRGTFVKTDVAGEYRITVQGEAKDPSSGEVVNGEASARFIVYDEDIEMTRRAADHDFLKKLARPAAATSTASRNCRRSCDACRARTWRATSRS